MEEPPTKIEYIEKLTIVHQLKMFGVLIDEDTRNDLSLDALKKIQAIVVDEYQR